MDLYETSSRASERTVADELSRLATRYEAQVKFFIGLALTVAAGFGLRIVFENQLGQVFGAMLVWFSILFGLAGIGFVSLFALRGAIATYRHGER